MTQIQSVEKMLAEARASPVAAGSMHETERQRFAELTEMRAKLAKMMRAHQAIRRKVTRARDVDPVRTR